MLSKNNVFINYIHKHKLRLILKKEKIEKLFLRTTIFDFEFWTGQSINCNTIAAAAPFIFLLRRLHCVFNLPWYFRDRSAVPPQCLLLCAAL